MTKFYFPEAVEAENKFNLKYTLYCAELWQILQIMLPTAAIPSTVVNQFSMYVVRCRVTTTWIKINTQNGKLTNVITWQNRTTHHRTLTPHL